MFKRKVYDELLAWKKSCSGRYAALLEGARRVGKSTIAEAFAKNEYESYILIDFANIKKSLLDVFEDIDDPDLFFLRLQAETGKRLIAGRSVIVFDEIQLAPKVRQAIKYLVRDGRYDYIETGSLISIKKNVKDIVIPSEEHKISVYPMDYEEFSWACGRDYSVLEQIDMLGKPMGDATNRKLMRDFRIYMAVGGMPQAVEAYVNGENFEYIDLVKREIISLYKDDFRKIDASGRVSAMYDAIPGQLAAKKKRFVLSAAIGKRIINKDRELLYELIDSRTVLPSYQTSNPGITLSQTKDFDVFKLYLADIGLFTTMLFNRESRIYAGIYSRLLSDKLDADLGYMYENAMAQIIASCGRELYFHTWTPEEKTHSYEVDFLVTSKTKLIPIEVKSSGVNNHKSIDAFSEKYSKVIGRRILFSQKDVSNRGMLEYKPIYLAPVIIPKL